MSRIRLSVLPPRLYRWLAPGVLLAGAFLLPASALADATADSKGSDWWGDNSGWQWNWPGISRKPGGTVKGEYKHWFEGAQPAAWTWHGPATWTLPAAANQFPFWPGSLTGDTGGNGAFSTDTHTDQATSDWKWETYRNNLLQNEIVFRKGTIAYANAKSVPNVKTAAHSRTRLVDPWEFANPESGEEWSIFGRVAPQASLSVSESAGEEASAFFELNYAASINGGTPTEIMNLHVGVNGEDEDVTLTFAQGVRFFRNGLEIFASQIIDELKAFYLPNMNWLLDSPTGVALDEGYYFDMAYNLPGSARTAALYSTPMSGADDARANAVPEPAPLSLLAIGALAALLRQRRASSAGKKDA